MFIPIPWPRPRRAPARGPHPLLAIACLSALVVGPVPSFAADPLVDLELHGTRLAPSCRADTWPRARQAIERAAAGRDAPQLLAVLRAYLCGDDAVARAQVARHAPRRILQVSEGTGEPTERRRVPGVAALEPRAGRVFDLAVRAVSRSRVAVQWQADEACVQGVDLAHRAAGWTFVRVGSACD